MVIFVANERCILAVIRVSSKLSSKEDQQCVCSKGFVFFRIVTEDDLLKVMTATAGEDTRELRPYHDQQRLLAATVHALSSSGMEYVEKKDWKDRPYIEAIFMDKADALHVANTILLSMGFEDIEVLALREMIDLHHEFSVDDDEDAYLSDGMWVTRDGRSVER